MNEDEFKRLYMDTHTELQLTEALENNGSLVKRQPEDKNITQRGKIPGKNIIEARAFEDRADKLKLMLLDAIQVKAKEVLDVPVERLIGLAIKTFPQKVDSHIEHEFTFAEWAKKCSVEIESYHPTIDAEAIEINDTEAS